MLSAARHDTVHSVREKVAILAASCRLALVILFAARELKIHDLTIAAFANQPSIEELAVVIRRLLP